MAKESTAICELVHLARQRPIPRRPSDQWLFVATEDEPTTIDPRVAVSLPFPPPSLPPNPRAGSHREPPPILHLETEPDVPALPPPPAAPQAWGTPAYAVADPSWLPPGHRLASSGPGLDPRRYALPVVVAAGFLIALASGAIGFRGAAAPASAAAIDAASPSASASVTSVQAPAQRLAIPASLLD